MHLSLSSSLRSQRRESSRSLGRTMKTRCSIRWSPSVLARAVVDTFLLSARSALAVERVRLCCLAVLQSCSGSSAVPPLRSRDFLADGLRSSSSHLSHLTDRKRDAREPERGANDEVAQCSPWLCVTAISKPCYPFPLSSLNRNACPPKSRPSTTAATNATGTLTQTLLPTRHA